MGVQTDIITDAPVIRNSAIYIRPVDRKESLLETTSGLHEKVAKLGLITMHQLGVLRNAICQYLSKLLS